MMGIFFFVNIFSSSLQLKTFWTRANELIIILYGFNSVAFKLWILGCVLLLLFAILSTIFPGHKCRYTWMNSICFQCSMTKWKPTLNLFLEQLSQALVYVLSVAQLRCYIRFANWWKSTIIIVIQLQLCRHFNGAFQFEHFEYSFSWMKWTS